MAQIPARPTSLLLAVLLLSASTADAATLTVTTLANAGAGSLREAITLAAPGDTIEFAVTGTILLTSGSLSIGKNLAIDGPGSSQLVINGGNARAFDVSAAANVTIRDLAIEDAITSFGAGIRNQGTLLLERVTLRNNYADSGSAGVENSGSLTLRSCLVHGNNGDFSGTVNSSGPLVEVEGTVFTSNYLSHGSGAIRLTAGHLIVRDSTFVGNVADGAGAIQVFSGATADIERSLFSANWGSVSGGAIINAGNMTLTNCTLTGNRSSDAPGAAIRNSGTVTTSFCTIVFNDARAGTSAGGVMNSGTFTAINTVFAGNLATANPDFSGTLTSAGHNLIQNPSGTVIVGDTTGNLLGVAPVLGALLPNGGPTRTHAAGSPVLDAGDSAGAPATDQRGYDRISDGDGDLVAIADIGAYERQAGCVDEDGDTFEWASVPGSACALTADCNDQDPTIFSGALEVNDGKDNECPGDDGFGLVDDLSGIASFATLADPTRYSWTAQGGATSYQIARGNVPGFGAGCTTFTTASTFLLDPATPASKGAFYYLVRPFAPLVGSFGAASSGTPRAIPCAP
jgi:hypothetical protein